VSPGVSELPAGWSWVSLRDVCDPVGTIDPKEAPASEFTYVDIASIDRVSKLIVAPKRLKGRDAPARARQRVGAGDVLFSTVRPNLQAVARVPDALDGEVASTGFCVLRPGGGIHPDFLFWAVLEPGFSSRVLAKARGVSYPAVRDRDVLEERIPLPAYAEQERLVHELERLLGTVAVGARMLASAREQIHALRRAVLQSAFGRAAGPRAGGEAPPPLPAGWEWSTIGAEGEVQLGRQRAPRYHRGAHMRPYLRVANVFDDRIDLSDVMEMDFPPPDAERYELAPGDILLNEGQSPELVGRPAMYRGELPGACFTNSLIRYRPRGRIDSEFALLLFRHYLYSGRFQREARITTNIAHLSAKRFAAVELPVPPLPAQREIVRETREQLAAADRLEATLEAALARARALERVLLRDALSGRLSQRAAAGAAA